MLIKSVAGAMVLCMLSTAAKAGDLFDRGKLLATGGVTQVEGAAGAGLSTWSLITGYGTDRGVGLNAHHSFATFNDFTFNATGVATGLFDRVELSYTHQWFDTRAAGAALGLGEGFVFEQDIIGAKVRLLGDAVYTQDSWLPQISAGVQYKNASEDDLVRALGAEDDDSFDYYIAASKILLEHSLLVSATARLTEANQFGLLGFGSATGSDYSLEFEGSLVALLRRDLVLGFDYRSKPNNLAFAEEDDSIALYAVYFPNKFASLTVGYADLGDIALQGGQRGLYISLQLGF